METNETEDIDKKLPKLPLIDTFDHLDIHQATEESSLLPWDKFSHWIHCICIVTFDLEVGQALELIYPRHVTLSDTERANICYLAFPDSNSGCMGDTSYHFRIRQCLKSRSSDSLSFLRTYNKHAAVSLQVERGTYYGYVYFRQRKDKSIRRGYFQKSVVVLSMLPFINLFTKVVNIIAPEFFENGEPGLEAACHDIDQWPAPIAGEELSLPVMGTVIQARIPGCNDKLTGIYPSPRPNSPVENLVTCILPSIHETNTYSIYQPVLAHLQLLWELVLCSEPLAVMASSPSCSAQAVQALVGLIWPLKYNTDYRPFFTIHDSEFKEYTTRTQAPPPVILGVTNPFFAKTLQHWPHIVRLGDTLDTKKVKVKKAGILKTLDSKPGVYTTYKPYLSKDKSLLKKLEQGESSNRPIEVQNLMLKRFFVELTHTFMVPLERYVAGLMPLLRNINPHKGTPMLGSFNTEDFIQTLDSSIMATGIKGDWAGLYRRFCQSANFQGWYNQKRLEANGRLQQLHVQALCDMDWLEWANGKQEVEVVDLLLRMNDKLLMLSDTQAAGSEASYKEVLEQHMKNIISTLPEDLCSVLSTFKPP
ncbi:protein DENND6A-like isoform X2 [Watersipora subatra]|uniref:protein DENND6A-like isoform X2 n=1 Tax=Watersipora subatra TaxID=2589382 RepID=UPI00355B4348